MGHQAAPVGSVSAPSATGSHQDDARLVSALIARDPSAFERLYDRWSTATYALAYVIVRDAGIAEQVIEDVFLSIWRQPEAALTGHSTVGDHLSAAVRSRALELAASHARSQTAGGGQGSQPHAPR